MGNINMQVWSENIISGKAQLNVDKSLKLELGIRFMKDQHQIVA